MAKRYRKTTDAEWKTCMETKFAMEVNVSPAALMQYLGPGEENDWESKINRFWCVKGPKGVVMIEDWKATSDYHPDLPSPMRFWAQRVVKLRVFAENDAAADDFVEWLGNRGVIRGVYAANRRGAKWRRNMARSYKRGIIIDVEQDNMGNVILTPRNQRVRRQMRAHNKEWHGHAEDTVFLQEWHGDEFLDRELTPAQARDVRAGWPVGIKMDPWEFGHYVGYDFHEVIDP